MKTLYHDSKAMLSVPNQTRGYVNENRQDINWIQIEMQYLLRSINAYAESLSNLTEQVKILELSRGIDGLISELEILVNGYKTQKAIFYSQKLQLEWGWLTEDILPPKYLGDLLNQVKGNGHEVLRGEWYYQHITVQPMWETASELTYQVMLPALSRERYLHFALHYTGVRTMYVESKVLVKWCWTRWVELLLNQVVSNAWELILGCVGHCWKPFVVTVH